MLLEHTIMIDKMLFEIKGFFFCLGRWLILQLPNISASRITARLTDKGQTVKQSIVLFLCFGLLIYVVDAVFLFLRAKWVGSFVEGSRRGERQINGYISYAG